MIKIGDKIEIVSFSHRRSGPAVVLEVRGSGEVRADTHADLWFPHERDFHSDAPGFWRKSHP